MSEDFGIYPATKSVYKIIPNDEVEKYTKSNPNKMISHFHFANARKTVYAIWLDYIHDYDEPEGNIEGVDYSDDAKEWPTVQECLVKNGLKEDGVDYLIDIDYDEF